MQISDNKRFGSESVLHIIDDEWNLDAKNEEIAKYFYSYDDIASIIRGRKCFVIGRKGSGKTAICEHIIESKAYNTSSTKLSFKNFPFNRLYSLEDKAYTRPNQFITLWKLLIYCRICEMMRDNCGLPDEITIKLHKVFPKRNITSLSNEINTYINALSIGTLGVNAEVGFGKQEKDKKIDWIEAVELLEQFVIENCTKGHTYFVVFDELDEDYNVTGLKDRRDEYFMLLTSLFKAVQYVKATFRKAKLDILPIVFLRDDIYKLIQDADKNKWRDFEVSLNWTMPEIKRLIAYRLAKVLNKDPIDCDFDTLWKVIATPVVNYGGSQRKTISTIDYISFSTLNRPRDFVCFIKLCCKEAIKRRENRISASVIHQIDREFSSSFRGELKDEIAPLIPQIDEVFSMISRMHKMIVPQDEFRTELDKLICSNNISDLTVDKIIQILFDFSVIGNIAKVGNIRKYFKYTHSNMTWNNQEAVVIHRGLFKSLHLE